MTPKEAIDEVGKHGRIFRVIFIKRTDGTERQMLCRFGVDRTTGGVLLYEPLQHGLVVVWDIRSHGYRMIPLASVQMIRGGGKIWTRENPNLESIMK